MEVYHACALTLITCLFSTVRVVIHEISWLLLPYISRNILFLTHIYTLGKLTFVNVLFKCLFREVRSDRKTGKSILQSLRAFVRVLCADSVQGLVSSNPGTLLCFLTIEFVARLC